MSETIPGSVTNAAGTLALLNGALNRFTRFDTVAAQRSPVFRNAS